MHVFWILIGICSLVYFSYGSVVNLYFTNGVITNYGRVQINPTVRVSRYSHGKHIIDLQQFAVAFVPSSFETQLNDDSATQSSNQ